MNEVSTWGIASSVAAPVLLIGGWTLAAHLQSGGFDPVTGTISALAAQDADHRWVMTTALAGVGAAHVTTALALRPATLASRLCFAAGGVATVLVAANPLPAAGGSAPAHAAAAGTAFITLALWPAISWQRSGRRAPSFGGHVGEHRVNGAGPALWPFRPAVAFTASAVLLAGLGWFFAELLQDGGRVGLSERVAAGSQALWPLAAVLTARLGVRRA